MWAQVPPRIGVAALPCTAGLPRFLTRARRRGCAVQGSRGAQSADRIAAASSRSAARNTASFVASLRPRHAAELRAELLVRGLERVRGPRVEELAAGHARRSLGASPGRAARGCAPAAAARRRSRTATVEHAVAACRARPCRRGSPRPSRVARPASGASAPRVCLPSERKRIETSGFGFVDRVRDRLRLPRLADALLAELRRGGDRVADRGAAVGLEEVELVERLADELAIRRRRRRDLRLARERDRARPCTRFGTRSRNVRTAACAAPRRVGLTSVACIEPGDVDDEDHRRLVARRRASSGAGARRATHSEREREQEQHRRRRSGATSGRRRPTRARRGS